MKAGWIVKYEEISNVLWSIQNEENKKSIQFNFTWLLDKHIN